MDGEDPANPLGSVMPRCYLFKFPTMGISTYVGGMSLLSIMTLLMYLSLSITPICKTTCTFTIRFLKSMCVVFIIGVFIVFDHTSANLSLSKEVDTYGHSYLNQVSHYDAIKGCLEL